MIEYELSTAEQTLLLELQAAAQRAAQEAVAPYDQQVRGILALVYRQQGLVGDYRLSEDRTRLVKVEG